MRRIVALALALALVPHADAGSAERVALEREPEPAPKGFLRLQVVGIGPSGDGRVLVLTDRLRASVLAIPVGAEAAALERRLAGEPADGIETAAIGRVRHVRIARAAGAWMATVVLDGPDGRVELDATPAEAVEAALATNAPVYALRRTVERAGLLLDPERDVPLGHELDEHRARAAERSDY